MPRVCTACAHAERDAIDRALIHGVPKRQIAASHGLADSALGRHARAHLPASLVTAEAARAAASAEALLGETLAMQAKALDLMAQAEAEGDVRGAIVALKEARECVALRARIGAELLATDGEKAPTTFAELARSATIQVEYVDPVKPDLARLTDDELRTAATLARKVRGEAVVERVDERADN